MIKTIAFDVWQTLGTYKFNLYKEVLKAIGLNMSLENFALKKSRVKVGESLNDKERFVKKIELMGIKDEGVLKKVESLYVDAHNSIFLYGDTLPALKSLKDNGKTLALITNVDRYAHTRIMRLFPKKMFSHVITSYKAGVRKPDKKIFQKLIEKNPIKPEEILMVGDSETMDIKPAKALGWKTCFINRNNKKSSHADYNIKSLKELIKITG